MITNLNRLDKLRILFSELAPKATFFAFTILTGMLVGFSTVSDFGIVVFTFSNVHTTTGYVDEIEDTNTSINGYPVEGYFFSFEVDGASYYAESFSHATYFDLGQEVEVEYTENNPYYARIKGTSRSALGPWVFVIILVIWLAVGFGTFFSLKKGMETLSIIHERVTTSAMQESRVKTNVQINNNSVYKLEYSYNVLGEQLITMVRTTDPQSYNEEEPLFYSKTDPSKAVLLRKLPKSVLRKLNPNK